MPYDKYHHCNKKKAALFKAASCNMNIIYFDFLPRWFL